MSAKPSKAVFRSMTPHERLVALALGLCRFPPASFAKRFAADISNQATLMSKEALDAPEAGQPLGKITDRQARQMAIQAYRFRRQMPPELVPAVAPEGYSTPKMAKEAARKRSEVGGQMSDSEAPREDPRDIGGPSTAPVLPCSAQDDSVLASSAPDLRPLSYDLFPHDRR